MRELKIYTLKNNLIATLPVDTLTVENNIIRVKIDSNEYELINITVNNIYIINIVKDGTVLINAVAKYNCYAYRESSSTLQDSTGATIVKRIAENNDLEFSIIQEN